MSVDGDCASMAMNFCEHCGITRTCQIFARANDLLDEDNAAIPDIIGECVRVQQCYEILRQR
jgi:hypothetical protein